MKSTMQKYIAAVAALLLLGGCVKEYPRIDASDEGTITLRLSLPRADNGGTRSIAAEPDPAGENKIDAINILALTENSGKWLYDYQAEILNTVQDEAELTVTARVRKMSTAQQFIIIANGAALLVAANPARYEDIADIENRLVCSAGSGEWPAYNNGIGGFTSFPMYARTDSKTIGAETEIGSYNLIRMVARIDVILKSEISNFTLTEACLFNHKTAGYVASFGNSALIGATPLEPTVPASGDHSGNPIKEPTVMYAADDTDDSRGAILSSIYTFESPAITSEAGMVTGTALVVGGLFGDETTQKSYYRIDLKTTEDLSANISSGILRNHLYRVEIKEVKGPGYETPKEAYEGGGVLTAVVEKWDNADQSVIFDRQYWLTVSEDELIIPAAGGSGNTVSFTAETNDVNVLPSQGYPSGIQIYEADIEYSPGGTNWLKPSVSGSTVILEAETNTGASIRYAKVYVQAGNMKKEIKVTQMAAYFPAYTDVIGYDPATGMLNLEGEGYMMYFKFGSVIGAVSHTNSSFSAWDNNYILFNPSDLTVGVGMNITGYGSNNSETPSIPGYVKADWEANLRNVSDPAYHNLENVKEGKGDPCKLVDLTPEQIAKGNIDNGLWRLPTDSELAELAGLIGADRGLQTGYKNVDYPYWVLTGTASWHNPGFGYFPIGNGTSVGENVGNRKLNMSGTALPAAGFRSAAGGSSDQLGSYGYYWSSCAYTSSGTAYNTSFYHEKVYACATVSYASGLSLRCVAQ